MEEKNATQCGVRNEMEAKTFGLMCLNKYSWSIVEIV